MPPAPRVDHRPGEVVAHAQRHDAVALHHRHRALHRLGEERPVVRIGPGAVHQQSDLEVLGRGRDGGHRVVVGEVHDEDPGIDAGLGADRRGDLVEDVPTPGQQHDVDPARGRPPTRMRRRRLPTRRRRAPTARIARRSRSPLRRSRHTPGHVRSAGRCDDRVHRGAWCRLASRGTWMKRTLGMALVVCTMVAGRVLGQGRRQRAGWQCRWRQDDHHGGGDLVEVRHDGVAVRQGRRRQEDHAPGRRGRQGRRQALHRCRQRPHRRGPARSPRRRCTTRRSRSPTGATTRAASAASRWCRSTSTASSSRSSRR